MSEIKLGWYRSKQDVVSLFDPVEVVYFDNLQVVHTTKNCGLKVEDSKNFVRYRDYIGTELGEWVSPDDVTIAEMRNGIKARFRNDDLADWIESKLSGFNNRSHSRKFGAAMGLGAFIQCQVWRSKK